MRQVRFPEFFSSSAEETLSLYAVQTAGGKGHNGNFNFISDLVEACREISDIPLVLIPSLSDENSEVLPDQWIRDQFKIGFSTCASREAEPVLVHFARRRSDVCGSYVSKHLVRNPAGGGYETFDDFYRGSEPDIRANYGGNVLESPTTPDGDPMRRLLVHGSCTGAFREHISRSVRPTLELDTSWLAVGHVDEIVAFAPSKISRTGSVALVATVEAGLVVLEELAKEKRVTTAFRGKWGHASGRYFHMYRECNLETIQQLVAEGNSELTRTTFRHSIAQLGRWWNYRNDSIVQVPVYFCRPDDKRLPRTTHALLQGLESLFPNLVNMQLVRRHGQSHAFLPVVRGPMIPRERAQSLLCRVFDNMNLNYAATVPVTGRGEWFWAVPGESLARIPFYFSPLFEGPEREIIRDGLRRGSTLDLQMLAIESKKYFKLIQRALEEQVYGASSNLNGDTFRDWTRLYIPYPVDEPLVDVFQCYMSSILSAHGITPHFLDSWELHARGGGIHCATNETTEPPAWFSGRPESSNSWRASV